jgi:hypothetical protein
VPADLGVDAASLSSSHPWPPLWVFLGGAAFVLLTIEWCLYQRRWIS